MVLEGLPYIYLHPILHCPCLQTYPTSNIWWHILPALWQSVPVLQDMSTAGSVGITKVGFEEVSFGFSWHFPSTSRQAPSSSQPSGRQPVQFLKKNAPIVPQPAAMNGLD